MKPAVMPRDVERLVVDFLEDALAEHDPDASVGIGVPGGWTPTQFPHLEVVSDGEPLNVWPIAMRATIRLVARAATTTDAKALCALAFGLLCAHNGDGVIVQTRPLTGVLAARDPDTHVEIASATVRVTCRTEPIPVGS